MPKANVNNQTSGDDRMTGGSGADTFWFNPTHGDDVITNFQPGIDSINMMQFRDGIAWHDLRNKTSYSFRVWKATKRFSPRSCRTPIFGRLLTSISRAKFFNGCERKGLSCDHDPAGKYWGYPLLLATCVGQERYEPIHG